MSQEDTSKKKFPERAKEKAARVKEHVKQHKTAYVAGATGVSCLIVGGAIGVSLGRAEVKQFVDSMKLVHIQYKSPNVSIALVKNACPDPIPVLDRETGIPYPSIRRASEMTKMGYEMVRKDAKGAQSRFERLPDSVFA